MFNLGQWFGKRSGAPRGALGIRGEGLFIFRELGGGHWKLFWGPGEQAHNFGNLGSPAQK